MSRRRVELRLTWEALADRAGVTAETVRAIRRGENLPSALTKEGLENALGWDRGSIDAIWSDGDPVVLADMIEPSSPSATAEGPSSTGSTDLAEIAAGVRELSERAAHLAERLERLERHDGQTAGGTGADESRS